MEHSATLKRHAVFNIDLCDRLPPAMCESTVAAETESTPYQILAKIRQMIKGMDLTIHQKPGDKAFYRENDDSITIPKLSQFGSVDGFYSVLLHKMTQATGHKKRLNRVGITSTKAHFGNLICNFWQFLSEDELNDLFIEDEINA